MILLREITDNPEIVELNSYFIALGEGGQEFRDFVDCFSELFLNKYDINLNKIGEKLGVGSYGNVYELAPYALKFTTDKLEINNSNLLKGKNYKHVVKIFRVLSFKDKYDFRKRGIDRIVKILSDQLGLVLMEKLEKPSEEAVQKANEIAKGRSTFVGKLVSGFVNDAWHNKSKIKKLEEDVKQKLQKEVGFEEPFEGYFDGLVEFLDSGIFFADWHSGNIMKRADGTHVWIDPGASMSNKTATGETVSLEGLLQSIYSHKRNIL